MAAANIISRRLSWKPDFCANIRGTTTVVFSIAATAVIGCVGMAGDYAYVSMKLAAVQSNLDAAVLAGVSGTLVPDKQIVTARHYFERFSNGDSLVYTTDFFLEKGILKGAALASAPTHLLKVLGINELSLRATSAATSQAALEPLCIMAMHPTRKHTLEMNGSVSLYAPDCNIYGNSNHEFDVVDPHTPQNFMTGKFVAAIGGGHHFIQNVSPPVEFGTKLVADPLKSLEIPSPGPCTATKYVISGKSMTLPQGHYCGGLTIMKDSQIELESGGTYFISGGALKINLSSVTGKDVTLFLTDSQSPVKWNESTVRISAKRSGKFAGIAVMGARVETDNEFTETTVDIHGALYMPNGAFTWENQGEPNQTAKWSAFVVDGFSWSGKGTIRVNFRPEDSDVPYPEDLIAMPRPAEARLVE